MKDYDNHLARVRQDEKFIERTQDENLLRYQQSFNTQFHYDSQNTLRAFSLVRWVFPETFRTLPHGTFPNGQLPATLTYNRSDSGIQHIVISICDVDDGHMSMSCHSLERAFEVFNDIPHGFNIKDLETLGFRF